MPNNKNLKTKVNELVAKTLLKSKNTKKLLDELTKSNNSLCNIFNPGIKFNDDTLYSFLSCNSKKITNEFKIINKNFKKLSEINKDICEINDLFISNVSELYGCFKDYAMRRPKSSEEAKRRIKYISELLSELKNNFNSNKFKKPADKIYQLFQNFIKYNMTVYFDDEVINESVFYS